MKIHILSVGKIKEKYLKDAISEYSKRLSKFCDLNIVEIEEATSQIENDASIKKALASEGNIIEKKLKDLKSDKSYTIALDIGGKELSTIEFHNKIKDLELHSISSLIFIIGGSYGLSDNVKSLSDFKLSFSKLTFPHQLFRVMLLEQIYRVFKIKHNEPYHK